MRVLYVLLVLSTLSFLSSSSELAFLTSYGMPFHVLNLTITEPLLVIMYAFSLCEICGLTRLWLFLIRKPA